MASAVAPFSTESGETIRATLFPRDGIGPEIAESVKQVFNVAGVPIEWEEHYVGTEVDPRTESFLTWESLESVRRNKVGLKGPMATPIGKGHRSLNLTLRKELGLYANVVRGVVESLEIITRQASLRVAEYAFHYAKANGRERVSAIHKANIMRKTDGLFLKCCREVAEKYPEIQYEEVIIDNCCMTLVKNPGGICLAEAVHGSAPDIAGKNLANPTALMLSAVMLLRHMQFNDKADRIHNAILQTIAEGKYRTADLGGKASTSEFTNAVCDHI
ncbi:isopropylmalate dehydrogenase1 [Zea mays]|uniref:Isopropylmalate dehydrogenase1 n=1 Tax=Zea mays TaxID=4577 RepID=A0A1D6JZ46_MAIZE|nr:isopropylmalate dehydrogenase1 [Zea mays]